MNTKAVATGALGTLLFLVALAFVLEALVSIGPIGVVFGVFVEWQFLIVILAGASLLAAVPKRYDAWIRGSLDDRGWVLAGAETVAMIAVLGTSLLVTTYIHLCDRRGRNCGVVADDWNLRQYLDLAPEQAATVLLAAVLTWCSVVLARRVLPDTAVESEGRS